MYVPVITNRSRAAPSSPLSKITVFISFSPLSVNISLAGVSGSTLIYSYGNLSKRGRVGERDRKEKERKREEKEEAEVEGREKKREWIFESVGAIRGSILLQAAGYYVEISNASK